MYDCTDPHTGPDAEIASYDVSEDGATWRPYDPHRDNGAQLHRRIVFADPQGD